MSHVYHVETVIGDVGYMRTAEKYDIRQILGHGASIAHDPIRHELRLEWNTDADSMYAAIDHSRATHFHAAEATGLFVPQTELFLVRKMTDST